MSLIDAIVSTFVAGAFALATSPVGPLDVAPVPFESIVSEPQGHGLIQVMNRYGEVVDNVPPKGASGMPISAYPKFFLDALILSEDKNFYSHPGVDGVASAKAAVDALRGRIRGGSGIAQQLAKNTVTGNEFSLLRKLEEAAIALRLVHYVDHDTLLEAYLANAWFGRGITGAADAPSIWFDKDWMTISEAEMLSLIVMLRGPARFDPYASPDRVKPMRDNLARRMLEAGLIDEEMSKKIIDTPVEAIPPRGIGATTWVGMAAARDVPGDAAGGVVVTTIDPDWQRIASDVLNETIGGYESAGQPGGLNGAVVIASVHDGAILASVGGLGDAGFDRTFAMRQPGSAAKPFFYLSALDQGMSPLDMVRNDRFYWDGWNPRNSNGRTSGPAPMFVGLEQSSNLMTLHLTERADMGIMFSVAEAAGAWEVGSINRGPASLLGSSETNLRSLVSGFAGIFSGGARRTLSSVVSDDPPINARFASQWSATETIRMMRGVVTSGTAANALAGLPVPVAGKTGTTQEGRDGLFVGGTPSFVIGVWAGRDDNRVPSPAMSGAGIPAAVFKAIVTRAYNEGLLAEDGYLAGQPNYGEWPVEPYSRNEASRHAPHIMADGRTEFGNGDEGYYSSDGFFDLSGGEQATMGFDASGLFTIVDQNADLWR